MFKQTAFILGLGLAFSLTACAKAGPTTETSAQSEQSKPVQSSPEQSNPRSSGERRGPPGGREGRGQGRTPPEAVYTACASAAIGSSCTIETPRGTRTGTCRTREGEDRAVCRVARPDGARRPRRTGE